MRAETPIARDLVLVGGGHAHVDVLKKFGMRPQPGTRITIIARDAHTPYSGMLPGLLAGHYSHGEAHIDLQPLSRFAGARLYHSAAVGIDFARRQVLCCDRPPVSFDVLSIDIGSMPSTNGIENAAEYFIPVKPVDEFLRRWEEVESHVLANGGARRIVVVGGGAGGVELSLSLQHRLRQRLAGQDRDGALDFTVITDEAAPLAGHSRSVREKMTRFLAQRGVRLLTGHKVVGIEDGLIQCQPADAIGYDTAVLVTTAAAAPWLRDTGLALDDGGFIRVDDCLRSTSHPDVFAAGDIAALEGHALAKSGVYAVRQGPVLAENLRAVLVDDDPRPYRPQRRTLALISSGDQYALASYGSLAIEGRWVWRLKDWIDRRWMLKYQALPRMTPEPATGDDGGAAAHALAMRCGGCGAKVASPVLRRVLEQLHPEAGEDVLLGLDAPDDAAVLRPEPGKLLVQTVDQFRAFIDDPYLFGRIAANHALGDVYAMGAEPRTALATATLPYGPEAKIEQDLLLLLTGALETLKEAGAALIGGHTAEGAEMSFGLTVNGAVAPEGLLRKGGVMPEQKLILTKPLGTGTIFAADMRGEARSAWVDAAVRSMLLSNREGARVLIAHGASACTDVTGFGLLGHLVEMLRASGVGARLDLAALPALAGAVDLLGRGIASSLHPGNESFAEALAPGGNDHANYPLLFDPQTAGGLLASVPAAAAAACVADLRAAGCPEATVIAEAIGPTSGALITIER